MTHNITEQEIKNATRWITSEPDNKNIEKILRYFHNNPERLEALEMSKDKSFKESFISLLYRYNEMLDDLWDNVVENEGTGRIILGVLMKENGLNQEEINELLNRNCWREATQFSVKNSRNFTDRGNYKTKRVNWKDKQERSLSVEEVLNVIENRAKEIEAKKQLTDQLALNQTIEEEDIKKFKEKYPQEIESFLLIKKEFENLKKRLEAAELDAKTHYEAIGVSEIWNKDKEKVLRKEIADKLELLQKKEGDLEKKEVQVKKLEKDLEESLNQFSEKSEKHEEQIKELQRKLYLATKPLPSLPKIQTPSKFKIFKEKTKTKFRHLVEKTKQQSQELIAKIEVKVK